MIFAGICHKQRCFRNSVGHDEYARTALQHRSIEFKWYFDTNVEPPFSFKNYMEAVLRVEMNFNSLSSPNGNKSLKTCAIEFDRRAFTRQRLKRMLLSCIVGNIGSTVLGAWPTQRTQSRYLGLLLVFICISEMSFSSSSFCFYLQYLRGKIWSSSCWMLRHLQQIVAHFVCLLCGAGLVLNTGFIRVFHWKHLLSAAMHSCWNAL